MDRPGIKTWPLVTGLLLLNFGIRLVIYYNTELFSFSDYTAYLGGIENITAGEKQYLLVGNYLFAISYMGYFAREVLGSLDWFFIFNCMLGSLTGLIIYCLIVRITGLRSAGIIALILLTFYTEFMVFSSVFYTPVLMIFLVSLIILLLWFYITSPGRMTIGLSAAGIVILFLLTFLFKPELKFLPWLLIPFSLFFIKTYRPFFLKTITLSLLLLASSFILNSTELITRPVGHVYSNSFIFYGHTDYGGDGGEGSFVYPENWERYNAAISKYFTEKNINNPDVSDYNDFQRAEIKNYITHHPLQWAALQGRKLFRTFGVIPETNSFKVLYTGLFKGKLWLTSIVVVVPVAMIIILFILFFPVSGLQDRKTAGPQDFRNNLFLYIYILLFFYYLLASVFFGQYQERYRLPMMVLFIIPVLGYFIATSDRKNFFKRGSLIIKGGVIVIFLTVWLVQAKKAVTNKERLDNAIESIKEVKSEERRKR